MGFNFGQTPNPMEPQPPDVSGADGFQHGSGAGSQGDRRMGRSERSSTVRPSSLRPIPPRRQGRSRDRAGETGPSLTPAGAQTRGEWEDQVADLTNRMLVVERKNRDLAQAVAAQDAVLEGYRWAAPRSSRRSRHSTLTPRLLTVASTRTTISFTMR